jgi:hypothetical protein
MTNSSLPASGYLSRRGAGRAHARRRASRRFRRSSPKAVSLASARRDRDPRHGRGLPAVEPAAPPGAAGAPEHARGAHGCSFRYIGGGYKVRAVVAPGHAAGGPPLGTARKRAAGNGCDGSFHRARERRRGNAFGSARGEVRDPGPRVRPGAAGQGSPGRGVLGDLLHGAAAPAARSHPEVSRAVAREPTSKLDPAPNVLMQISDCVPRPT